MNVQKILPTILIHAQQPINIHCFGSIPCNRETFKKVKANLFAYIKLRDFIFALCAGDQFYIFIFYDAASIWTLKHG